MRTTLKQIMIMVAAMASLSACTAHAELEVSAAFSIHAATDFYAPLASCGAWVEVAPYGRCWHPARVAAGWRPYCYGHWVWTDCGWYWASDEPWAWACYHYGCWDYDEAYGWFWIPGIEWAPAWVTWRIGGGFIGWAPCLPPRVALRAPAFAFVKADRFTRSLGPSVVTVNSTKLFSQTAAIGNVRRESRNIGGAGPQRVVINEGPGLAPIQSGSGNKAKVVLINEAARRALPPAGFYGASHGVQGTAGPPLVPASPAGSLPERRPMPAEKWGPPPRTGTPGDQLHTPPPPASPPPRGPSQSEERDREREHEPEGGHHGKD